MLKTLLKLPSVGTYRFAPFSTWNEHLAKPYSGESFGQPTPFSHPHLLKEGELQPKITKGEFQQRRQRLVESTRKQIDAKDHLIVIPSASTQYMSDKIPYVFRQNSDFMYLSGCSEPESCLVLMGVNSPSEHRSVLFLRDKDPLVELWEGPRTSVQSAVHFFGVNDALPIENFQQFIEKHLESHRLSTIWYDYEKPSQPYVETIMQKLSGVGKQSWRIPTNLVHQHRLIKSLGEIALLQQSCEIASQAIVSTIKESRPDINEHEIFAKVDYQCRMKGANFLAYPPVVAGGHRATIIHYINNNQIVHDNEMVLLDAGCEFHGYSSDITRTWPVNGKYTPQQQLLYEIVQKTQQDLINNCSEFPTLNQLFELMCVLLGKYLQEAGLLSKTLTKNDLNKEVYNICPHHVSHYLGMDVHDTPSISRNINVEPGMIITVEPGIYVTRESQLPLEFHGIGIRIEDDVLITAQGPKVLTESCPKNTSDIEQLIK